MLLTPCKGVFWRDDSVKKHHCLTYLSQVLQSVLGIAIQTFVFASEIFLDKIIILTDASY